MSDYKSEILISLAGIVTSITAWILGGKQSSKNQTKDTLTAGADRIVETSNKLLTRLEQMLDEETKHKENCEKSLKEHKRLINELRKKVENLERKNIT